MLRRLKQTAARAIAGSPLFEWAPKFLPRHFFLPASQMHRWLADRLEHLPPGGRLAVIAARDSAKSTWLSFAFPLYAALTRRDRYILLIAETENQARRYLRAIRKELESNEALKLAYGKAAEPGDQWSVDRITLASGVEIEAVGTGTSIRGRKNLESRPTLVIVDDPQDRRHITSVQARASDWMWFTQDLLNVGIVETRFLVAGTALHRDAIVDRLHREPAWKAKRFPAIERFPIDEERWRRWRAIYTNLRDENRVTAALRYYQQHEKEMKAGATVCWPERESLYSLMRMQVDLGPSAFAAEKQGLPINPEFCEWPAEHFAEHIWFDHWPFSPAVKTLALDPSKGSDARLGDYSAYAMLAVDGDGTLFVDADLRRRGVEEMIADGVVHYAQFQPDAFGCESNAWQHLLAEPFAAAFAAAGLLSARTELIENRQNKLLRIRLLGRHLASRRLRFKRNSPGAKLLVEQLTEFPLAQHDDGPDALAMAIDLAEHLLRPATDDGLGTRLTSG